jgi:hypothetical protein
VRRAPGGIGSKVVGLEIGAEMSVKRGFAILGVVAVPLGAIITWELRVAAPVIDDPPMVVRTELPVPAIARPGRPDRAEQWVAAILARPLFSPTRRASVRTPQDGGTAAPPGLPRLAGILVSPLGKAAIFAGIGETKPVVVREGARVGSYVVRSIRPDQITLRGPDGERIVSPSYEAWHAPSASPVAPMYRSEALRFPAGAAGRQPTSPAAGDTDPASER